MPDVDAVVGERLFSSYLLHEAASIVEEAGFTLVKSWSTRDPRLERGDERWVNVLARKG